MVLITRYTQDTQERLPSIHITGKAAETLENTSSGLRVTPVAHLALSAEVDYTTVVDATTRAVDSLREGWRDKRRYPFIDLGIVGMAGINPYDHLIVLGPNPDNQVSVDSVIPEGKYKELVVAHAVLPVVAHGVNVDPEQIPRRGEEFVAALAQQFPDQPSS